MGCFTANARHCGIVAFLESTTSIDSRLARQLPPRSRSWFECKTRAHKVSSPCRLSLHGGRLTGLMPTILCEGAEAQETEVKQSLWLRGDARLMAGMLGLSARHAITIRRAAQLDRSSAGVTAPVGLRSAWESNHACNLVKAGLPPRRPGWSFEFLFAENFPLLPCIRSGAFPADSSG